MENNRIDNVNLSDELYTRHNGLYDLIVIALSFGLYICFWLEATAAINITVMALFFFCTYAQIKEKRYGCFFFYITFFLFLLDTVFFGIFDKAAKYCFASSEIENHVLLCLGVSIIGVYVGAAIRFKYRFSFGTRRKAKFSNSSKDRKNKVSRKMQLFLKWMFLFCGIFSVIDAAVKAVFVQSTSYLAYYSEFETPLPYFMRWLSSVSPIFFYFYLGTQPTKRDAQIPFAVYILVGVISLFFGQRNILVVRGIIALCYYLIRNKYASSDEIWISRRQLRLVILLIPLAIFFMGFWGTFRYGEGTLETGIWDSIRNALLGQGNNIQILDFEYRYGHILPDKKYALGGIITFLHNNILGRLMGLAHIPADGHTTEIIIEGYSFEAALMAINSKNAYLLGYGMGSCYIAELINSFGMIGMFFGSVIYGIVLRKLNEVRLNGFLANGFALYMFQRLLMAPRATFDGFISGTFQIANLFIALLCWLLSRYVWPEGD